MKRRMICALLVLTLLCALAMSAYAAEAVDFSRTGSISITMTYQDAAVPGGSLTLYKVADVAVDNQSDYSFRYTEAYADCEVSLEELNASQTSQALAEYTAAQEIPGVKQEIDEAGKVFFGELELGLYLLVQEDPAEGYDTVNPFLVSVPGRQDDSYVYEVNASPKLNLEPLPTDPPTEPTDPPPPPPDIPQTGQTKWPIPLLLVGGLLLVVAGVWLTVSGRKKGHEN